MELKIGNKTYKTKTLTADFPIKFYKETGMDVFRLEEAEADGLNDKMLSELCVRNELEAIRNDLLFNNVIW